MATACAATTTAATGGRGRTAGSFGAVGRRGKDGKLDRVLAALTLRAGDFRSLVHDDALVVLAAVVADVFVDGH